MFSLSTKAVEDIESIIDYTLKDFGYDATLEYHQSLDGCFDNLSESPNIGLDYKHISLGYFCFYCRSHAVFYKKQKDDIHIVRILHQSMDAPQYFD